MLIDSDFLTAGIIKRLSNVASEIITDIDKTQYYIKYKLYMPSNSINKHIINWLYTVKCESGASGMRFIDIVLWGLKNTLKRNLDDVQFAYIKALIIIFISERKKRMEYGYNRRNLA